MLWTLKIYGAMHRNWESFVYQFRCMVPWGSSKAFVCLNHGCISIVCKVICSFKDHTNVTACHYLLSTWATKIIQTPPPFLPKELYLCYIVFVYILFIFIKRHRKYQKMCDNVSWKEHLCQKAALVRNYFSKQNNFHLNGSWLPSLLWLSDFWPNKLRCSP